MRLLHDGVDEYSVLSMVCVLPAVPQLLAPGVLPLGGVLDVPQELRLRGQRNKIEHVLRTNLVRFIHLLLKYIFPPGQHFSPECCLSIFILTTLRCITCGIATRHLLSKATFCMITSNRMNTWSRHHCQVAKRQAFPLHSPPLT